LTNFMATETELSEVLKFLAISKATFNSMIL